MKAKFTFSDLWQAENLEVQYWRDTELEFVPFIGMQFNFPPAPFELFVDVIMWDHDKNVLIVGFDYPKHDSKENFIESVRSIIADGLWKYQFNKDWIFE